VTSLTTCKYGHQNTEFTIDTEGDSHLPFLEVDIYRRRDDFLAIKCPINVTISGST
jgi:hypothetical protein